MWVKSRHRIRDLTPLPAMAARSLTHMPDLNDITLVTGAGGFIGFHVSRQLGGMGRTLVGADVMNAYYDVSLKEARVRILEELPGFSFERVDLADRTSV